MLLNNSCKTIVISSTWWKDLIKIEVVSTNPGFGFVGNVHFKIGDNNQI